MGFVHRDGIRVLARSWRRRCLEPIWGVFISSDGVGGLTLILKQILFTLCFKLWGGVVPLCWRGFVLEARMGSEGREWPFELFHDVGCARGFV